MDKKTLMIKVIRKDAAIPRNCPSTSPDDIIWYANDSLQKGEPHYYNVGSSHAGLIGQIKNAPKALVNSPIVFVDFVQPASPKAAPTDPKPAPEFKKLYIGRVISCNATDNHAGIQYQTEQIASDLVSKNFLRYIDLDCDADWDDDGYAVIVKFQDLANSLFHAIQKPRTCQRTPVTYKKLQTEKRLDALAQRNEYCVRMFDSQKVNNACGAYQEDCNRIVQSKAFRRMSDKAQVFTGSKGDHYRTRLPHSLCVAQIARTIAQRLKMNISLAEAIALGHDLGHTPFGHQGERTLDQMTRAHSVHSPGFKHNFQSLKVATMLEEMFVEHSGMDLSLQTLEGMWKHTKIRKKPDDPKSPLICNPEWFIPAGIDGAVRDMLHEEFSFPSTIEGQIVAIADEIAQRSHDIEDAMSANMLTIDKLYDCLSLMKFDSFKKRISRIRNSINNAENDGRYFASSSEMLCTSVCSDVIDYFIDDVVAAFKETRKASDFHDLEEFFKKHHYVNRKVITFTAKGKDLCDYLEKIVTKQVVGSSEVAAFDDKAGRVTAKLFELYYNNPRLLHEGTIQRIYTEMRRHSDNVIHFRDGDIDLIREEIAAIKNGFTKEYSQKHVILITAICDFISGMTDTYALAEFRNLEC